MKPKLHQLLETCIIDGITIGHNRAYKHNDAPNIEEINEAIFNAIMLEIYEWFDFESK